MLARHAIGTRTQGPPREYSPCAYRRFAIDAASTAVSGGPDASRPAVKCEILLVCPCRLSRPTYRSALCQCGSRGRRASRQILPRRARPRFGVGEARLTNLDMEYAIARLEIRKKQENRPSPGPRWVGRSVLGRMAQVADIACQIEPVSENDVGKRNGPRCSLSRSRGLHCPISGLHTMRTVRADWRNPGVERRSVCPAFV
jgi:hypothetical protein